MKTSGKLASGQNLLHLLILLGLIELVLEDLDVETLELGRFLDAGDEAADIGLACGTIEGNDRALVLRDRRSLTSAPAVRQAAVATPMALRKYDIFVSRFFVMLSSPKQRGRLA